MCFHDIPTTTAAQRLERDTSARHYEHIHSTVFSRGGARYNALHCSDAGIVGYAVLDATGQYGCWLSAKLWLLSQRPLQRTNRPHQQTESWRSMHNMAVRACVRVLYHMFQMANIMF